MSIILFNDMPVQPENSDVLIDEIKAEYRRIDNDWLHLHFRILAGLVIFALLAECFMAFVLMNTHVVTTTTELYILKFILAPSSVNLLGIFAGSLIIKSRRLSQSTKIHAVSLLFVLTATVLFIAHNIFAVSFIFFIFAIMLTTVYSNISLTAITAFLSFALMIFSELFIVWDVDKVSVFESTQRMGDFLISVFIMIAVFAVSLIEIYYTKKKNEVSIQKELDRQLLKQKLQFDTLTGVYSRQALHEAMMLLESKGYKSKCIFAIADVDNFKSINDEYGHHIGDEYLIQFARILNKNCGCHVYRYGGDEFCLLFHDIRIDKAVALCRQIQASMSDIPIEGHPEIKHTASFGLAVHSDRMSTADLFMHADQALYAAKQSRNAIKVY